MSCEPKQISQRQFRNESGAILRAVEQGESFIITNNGRPVAKLHPISADPLAGLRVRRSKPGARFANLKPESVTSDETALEALMFLRGTR